MEEEHDGKAYSYLNFPYTSIANEVILNKNIDFYTLGVFVRLVYLIEHGIDQDILADLGNIEFIKKAMNKLKEEKYIEEAD